MPSQQQVKSSDQSNSSNNATHILPSPSELT
jgi:hypothetical protein